MLVHAFMDGRDTMPTSGLGYLEALEQQFREIGVGQLASVSGRYFAMDRDLRWEKSKQAFDAMVTGTPEGGRYADALGRVRELYSNGTSTGRGRVYAAVYGGGCGGEAGRADPG